MNKIIPYGKQHITKQDTEAVINTLQSDFLTQGPQIAAFAEQNFERMNLSDTITVFTGNIDEKLPQTDGLIDQIDFAFIDANHKFTPTLKYFSWLAEKSHPDTIIVLDDIHWSKQMEQAWLEVQNMPGVTITVDLYRFGLVFFKTDQAREHFKIWV